MFCFQKLESLTMYIRDTLFGLERFCKAMPQITKLNLSSGDQRNRYDGALRAIGANMHHLKSLDISWCSAEPKSIEHLLPTEDNALGGCPELEDLDLWGVRNVDVELLKKILLALPKLRILRHRLLVDALRDLTEEEMGEDTLRYLNISYCDDRSKSIRCDILAKSPIFYRFKHNITTAVIRGKRQSAKSGQQETASLADALMSLPKLNCLKLSGISEAHEHVLPLLDSIGDRLVLVELFDLSGYLSVQDIMRTCTNVVELELCYRHFKNGTLKNGSNKLVQQNQIESTSKMPVLHCLTKVILGHMNKEICSSDMLIALLQSPNLENVLLGDLEAMTDDVMWTVLSSSDCAGLSKVTRFSVSHCPLITEAPLVHWINREDCSLQYIIFSNCPGINCNSLKAAAKKCHKALRIEEVSLPGF